jgi:N-acetyl-gamma-glutamyl-phosphate reductase
MRQGQRRIPAAVVNGTGYGGVELLRFLAHHPFFELIEVTARSEAGKTVTSVFPSLGTMDLTFTAEVERSELVFVALPDQAATILVPELLADGRRVVDLSAGFRLHDPSLYPRWYGYEHPAAVLLEEAIYGLAEWARSQLPAARLVACPGCYPTAALLALAPALTAGLVLPDVIVDAKSGLSGAGRKLSIDMHYSEANEDTSAYGIGGHRHSPEIHQELAGRAPVEEPLRLTFTPHLVPMTRGILATCYATLAPGVSAETVNETYRQAYGDALFVRLCSSPPHTKWTLGSNLCFIYPVVEAESRRLIVVSALDNLIKGASGQAIQCANLMYGLAEDLGLPREGVYP